MLCTDDRAALGRAAFACCRMHSATPMGPQRGRASQVVSYHRVNKVKSKTQLTNENTTKRNQKLWQLLRAHHASDTRCLLLPSIARAFPVRPERDAPPTLEPVLQNPQAQRSLSSAPRRRQTGRDAHDHRRGRVAHARRAVVPVALVCHLRARNGQRG